MKGGSLTVRDSGFTSYVGTWRPPAAGCTTATTPPTSAPAGTLTTQPQVPLPPSVPAMASPAATATIDAPGLVYAAPTTTAAAAPVSTKKGMSTGSVIAIAFGLVLIGGGGILLTRVIKALRDPA